MPFDDTNTVPLLYYLLHESVALWHDSDHRLLGFGELLAGEIWSDTVVVWRGATGEREEGEYKRKTFFTDTMKTTFSTEYLTLFIKNKRRVMSSEGFSASEKMCDMLVGVTARNGRLAHFYFYFFNLLGRV